MDNLIKVKADFSGGLDLVFDGQAEILLQVPQNTKVSQVIKILGRPGILVLVNEVDWELADKQQCVLENGDKVSFISTLHGG